MSDAQSIRRLSREDLKAEIQEKLSDHNPIMRVGVLAKARVPVFISHGDEG